MRNDVNITVIGSSTDINNAITDLLPRNCNSVFTIHKSSLKVDPNEYHNVVEQSEAIILDLSASSKSDASLIKYLNDDDNAIPIIAVDRPH